MQGGDRAGDHLKDWRRTWHLLERKWKVPTWLLGSQPCFGLVIGGSHLVFLDHPDCSEAVFSISGISSRLCVLFHCLHVDRCEGTSLEIWTDIEWVMRVLETIALPPSLMVSWGGVGADRHVTESTGTAAYTEGRTPNLFAKSGLAWTLLPFHWLLFDGEIGSGHLSIFIPQSDLGFGRAEPGSHLCQYLPVCWQESLGRWPVGQTPWHPFKKSCYPVFLLEDFLELLIH